MVEMAVFNIQRAITLKEGNLLELWLMCSAHRLMMFYIYVKFHEKISNGFQLTKRTRAHGRNGYIPCSNDNNSKSRKPRVMVHALCTLSRGDLHLCEFL